MNTHFWSKIVKLPRFKSARNCDCFAVKERWSAPLNSHFRTSRPPNWLMEGKHSFKLNQIFDAKLCRFYWFKSAHDCGGFAVKERWSAHLKWHFGSSRHPNWLIEGKHSLKLNQIFEAKLWNSPDLNRPRLVCSEGEVTRLLGLLHLRKYLHHFCSPTNLLLANWAGGGFKVAHFELLLMITFKPPTCNNCLKYMAQNWLGGAE
jgi:hypothetical protein